jgi:UDP-N-acetylmuramate: L-alanyl-gamma-D-glutamyl-meso-diaminopimelate ligase
MFAHKNNHIHFIGICGVAMSALAILWKKKGWKVTGSDVGFYPPISTHLEKNNIEFYPGWHPEKMGIPDLVIIGGGGTGSENPELLHVLKYNIPHLSYPELIAQNLVKENSIVCAGTYGKTSTTTLLSLIFRNADYQPSYMFGGLSLDLETSANDVEDSKWSILEGDEYKTSRDNLRAKFFSYKPTHLLLTSVDWDHADVYKTESDYQNAFKELITLIPENGKIVLCSDHKNVDAIINQIQPAAPIIAYGKNSYADYIYSAVKESTTGLSFAITHHDQSFQINTPVLGAYMAENICGAFAMAYECGIEPESIIKSIANFHGLKRRLEKRGTVNGAIVFDDIAHSPNKAKSVLETLRRIYQGKIIAVFEPNTGNRREEALPQYSYAFSAADEIIIPAFTKLKKDCSIKILEAVEIANEIKKTQPNTQYFTEDSSITTYLKQKTQPDDVVVFMGSHGFRGMIESILL